MDNYQTFNLMVNGSNTKELLQKAKNFIEELEFELMNDSMDSNCLDSDYGIEYDFYEQKFSTMVQMRQEG